MARKRTRVLLILSVLITLIFIAQGILFLTSKNNTFIPILLYHNFDYKIKDSLLPTTITPDEFEEQIKYLTSNGYTGITFTQLYNYINGKQSLPAKPFIVTMDDGYYSNYKYAYPILKKYNTPSTIFVVSSYIGNTKYTPFLNWKQAKEMESSGLIEIQNHSSNHKKHDQLQNNQLISSITTAQKAIEDNLGKRQIKVFSYPGGRYNAASIDTLKRLGFQIQLTSLNGIPSKHSDLSNLKRINVKHGMTGKDIIKKIEILKLVQKTTNIY
ncbi:MAG: polysaccharide deacetylase family protein [Deltaproteobacteria bacterium]